MRPRLTRGGRGGGEGSSRGVEAGRFRVECRVIRTQGDGADAEGNAPTPAESWERQVTHLAWLAEFESLITSDPARAMAIALPPLMEVERLAGRSLDDLQRVVERVHPPNVEETERLLTTATDALGEAMLASNVVCTALRIRFTAQTPERQLPDLGQLAASVQREVHVRGPSDALAHYLAQFLRTASETRGVLHRTVEYGDRQDGDPNVWCRMLLEADELLPRAFALSQSTVLALKIHHGLPSAALDVFRGAPHLEDGALLSNESTGAPDGAWCCACGANNRLTAKYCKACALAKPRTQRRCKHCNAVNDRDARFCDQCGRDMLPLG